MTTPINPDAVTRLPRTPQPTTPSLGHVSPASFARALRQRALLPNPEVAAGLSPADESDSGPWLSVHWIHAAFLARQAMEQAFAVQRGDEA